MHRVRASLPLLVLAAALAAAPGCASSEAPPGVPYGQNALLREEIERRVGEIRYLHGRELLDNLYALAALGDEATPHLLEALRADNALTRSSVAWVMGVRGDRRNIPAVRALLADPVSEVRYEAAASLVRLGDPRGFHTLVDGLADGEIRNRYKCFQVLQVVTGHDFGYQHDADPDTRRQALVRWTDWLDTVQPTSL